MMSPPGGLSYEELVEAHQRDGWEALNTYPWGCTMRRRQTTVSRQGELQRDVVLIREIRINGEIQEY